MNLKYVADTLVNKGDAVITVGIDDTVKAPGRQIYNVKADHITVAGPDRKRILTETTSQAGEDNAIVYEQKLKYLAILADTSVEDIKGQIDFWMSIDMVIAEQFLNISM